MSSELIQNADAPGIQVYEIPSEPRVPATSTDVGGQVGVTRRGPIDKGVAIRNFEEFKKWFGGYFEGNFVPIQVDQFFKQRKGLAGGSRIVVNRVLGTGNAKGSVNLEDSNATGASAENTIKIEAQNPGKWSNDADVTTRKYLFETTASLTVGLTSIGLNSIQGVEVGDLLRINDGTTYLWVYVRSIDLATKTVSFKATSGHATIASAATVESVTVHRASTKTAEDLNNGATQLLVDSGRNFKKGMRVLIDDPTNDKITSILITRVNGDYLQFDALSLTELADIENLLVTSINAKVMTDSELTGFDGLTHNIVGKTLDITGGTGSPQSKTVDAIDESSGEITVDTNWSEDLDATSTYEMTDVEISGLAATADGNGVQSTGTITIINNAYDGGDKVTVNGTDVLATAFDTGTINGDATALAALISAIAGVSAIAVTGVVTITADSWDSAVGDAITLAEVDGATDNFTLSGATLAGGVTPVFFTISGLTGFENDKLNGASLVITSGAAAGTYTITAFGGGVGKITCGAGFPANPLIGDTATIDAWTFTGTVDASTNNTLTCDTLKPENQFGVTLTLATLTLDTTAGTGSGQTKTISAFNGTSGLVTVDTDWDTIPDGTTVFKITAVPNKPSTYASGANAVSMEQNFLVYELNQLLETHTYLSMEPTSENYIEKRLAGDSNESVLVVLTDLSSSIYTTGPILALTQPYSRAALSGGLEGSVPTDTEIIGESGIDKSGVYLFNEHDISFFSIPGYYSKSVEDAATAYAEARGDIDYISSTPSTADQPLEALDHRQQTLNNKSSRHLSLYWPWAYIQDPESSNPNARVLIPPEGFVQGVWARVSANRGVHKAPANELINGCVGLAYNSDEAGNDQGLLNPEGINCIIFARGEGFLIYGARTCDRNPGKRQFVNVGRIYNMIKRSSRRGNRWAAFEPNDRDLAGKLVRINKSFLRGLWRQKMLVPLDDFSQAASVVCDDSNNPKSSVDAGLRYMDMLFDPSVPAERVRIRIGIMEEVGVLSVEES